MFREKLMQIMYNKYGNDKLNVSLIGISFFLAILNLFIGTRVIYFIQTLCLVLFFVRFFSSNHQARMKENEKFSELLEKLKLNKSHRNNPYKNDFYTTETEVAYKYFKCKSCGAKLRVPKHKGKITITCPKCRTSFKGKS